MILDGHAAINVDVGPCHCLCPIHRADGMFCLGEDGGIEQVRLVGGVIDAGRPIPMCPPCAQWWRTHRPDRVVEAPEPASGFTPVSGIRVRYARPGTRMPRTASEELGSEFRFTRPRARW